MSRSCRPAPACKAALAEASRRWPGRDRASDGTCASAQHTKINRHSDHEPDAEGFATAFDVDHDPDNGFDATFWAEQLRERKDPRVKYVIYRGRMFSSYSTPTRKAWEWGAYTGPNPHIKHMHVSVLPERKYDDSPWWTARQPEEEHDMPQPTDKVDAIVAPNGGTWVLQRDGGVFAYGGAPFHGSYPGLPEKDRQGTRTFLSIQPRPTGGYTLISEAGERYDFGP